MLFVLLFNTCAATQRIADTAWLETYDIQSLAEMVSALLALKI